MEECLLEYTRTRNLGELICGDGVDEGLLEKQRKWGSGLKCKRMRSLRRFGEVSQN